jgi:tRNA nucleotidyltransferase (CCA-adding enzyme)
MTAQEVSGQGETGDQAAARLGVPRERVASLAQGFSASDPATDGLSVYVVGGAVRDDLLGLPAGDRDWVVVGASPEDMTKRKFLPVGGDFPVFLHPRTKEEYALARTERKSGRGYRGFTFYAGPEVTLEDDLSRRDLRINAMARGKDGTLVDPFDGQADLAARLFRHVGDAFSEDPVRILRLARFAARFADFTVADDTLALCQQMVAEGEADALVPERVWREMSRGLMQDTPSRMLAVLRDTHALPHVAPALELNDAVIASLDAAAALDLPLMSRYALLCAASPQAESLAERWRVPSEARDAARLLQLLLARSLAGDAARDPDAALDVIERTDGLRKPDRLTALLQAAALRTTVDQDVWQTALKTVLSVDAGAIAKAHAGEPRGIKDAVRAARRAALATA